MDKDWFNYETEARSHAGFNHLNQRFNTFIENKDGLKGNTYDARGKFLDEEYDEPQCLNINSDAFIKPLKFHIDDDSTLNKIKRLESEVMRLKPFEQQVTRQKYTIKTLKGMIVTSKKQPQINAFELNDMSSWLALQAKIIEELSKQQSEENEE